MKTSAFASTVARIEPATVSACTNKPSDSPSAATRSIVRFGAPAIRCTARYGAEGIRALRRRTHAHASVNSRATMAANPAMNRTGNASSRTLGRFVPSAVSATNAPPARNRANTTSDATASAISHGTLASTPRRAR